MCLSLTLVTDVEGTEKEWDAFSQDEDSLSGDTWALDPQGD
jgi:hypothetical protein